MNLSFLKQKISACIVKGLPPLKSCQGDAVPLTPARFLEKAGQKLLLVIATNGE